MLTRCRQGSVNVFYRRVVMTFALILFVGLLVLVILVYRPMSLALEQSLLENFSQMSLMNSESIKYSINQGIQGGESLSNRVMIKRAMVDYLDGKLSYEELQEYTRDRYEDGASVLENIQSAKRIIVGTGEIASYYAPNRSECVEEIKPTKYNQESSSQELVSTPCEIYSIVVSPIIENDRFLGFDELVFDLSEKVKVLNLGDVSTHLADSEGILALDRKGEKVFSDEKLEIYQTPDSFVSLVKLEKDIFFLTTISKERLLAPISRLKTQVIVSGVLVLIVLLAIVQFYIVSYARREFIHLEKEQKHLKVIADEVNTDPLTKSASRKSGIDYLEEAFVNYKSGRGPVAIVLIDIDKFKNINDTYGHDGGDRILISLVERIKETVRNSDLIFRWGGDEFVIVFNDVNKENIDKVIQKIFEVISSRGFFVGIDIVDVTVSAGVTFFQEDDQDFENALNRADKAMYKSKEKDGNAVSYM